ncbi:DUF99 family protein [Candidatus Woesearchaeota archaeon]|nr:DUF99 family protein [Candidatus Woesearchaeota archaeon]
MKRLKAESRILGIDDGPFVKHQSKETLVVGVMFRGGAYLDGLLSTQVRVDGDDATEKLSSMISRSKFCGGLYCILIDGIALGGFNVIDIQTLRKQTGVPVICVIRRKPDIRNILRVLDRIGMGHKRALIEKLGEPRLWRKIWYQCFGIDTAGAEKVLALTCTRSEVPEPIRVAHIIASGIVTGESKGRA